MVIMTGIILHHFDISPFAEKIRLALGLKNLNWQSVEIPLIMPKPDLTILTGGYRKTPVMQIGADIYCDTQRIADELEQRFPEPTLFPGNSRALSAALSQWSDVAFFQPGAGLSMATNAGLPEDILEDRKAFFNFLDFGTLERQLPHLYSQFRAHLQLVNDLLEDGREFVLGAEPGWGDILAYFPLWMSRGNIANASQLVQGLPALASWESRVRAIGHGHSTPLQAAAAIAIAHAATSATPACILADAWPQLELGARVTVTPQDYGAVPVTGQLLRLTHNDIAIQRLDSRAGEVVVHFPRLGYTVQTA
jgi:glutathione S-transferase